MNKKCEYIDSCSLYNTLEALKKKWAILIISVIGYHKRLRFNELMDLLTDISPKALSDTLKELEIQGIIKRESFAEIPPRVEYILTNDGSELREIIIVPFLKWIASRNSKSLGSNCICQRMPVPMWPSPVSDNAIEARNEKKDSGIMPLEKD